MASTRTYVANFHPEAWIHDCAIGVDPEGAQDWDVTATVVQDWGYWADMESLDGGFLGILDRDDTLKDDPNAPEWVRSWTGPFTIRVHES